MTAYTERSTGVVGVLSIRETGELPAKASGCLPVAARYKPPSCQFPLARLGPLLQFPAQHRTLDKRPHAAMDQMVPVADDVLGRVAAERAHLRRQHSRNP
jgi:hypothetical protein